MCDLTNPIFTDENAARKHLESILWPDGPVCPHCGALDRIKLIRGKSARPGLRYCNECKKQFTVTVGTVYERSKIPLHMWLLATHLMCASKKGVSAHQLHRMLGVTYKTAWFMAHRIREAMKPDKKTSGPLGGEGKHVEADETYLGAPKNRYRTIFVSGRGWMTVKADRLPKKNVVTLVERGGQARSFIAVAVTTKRINEIIFTNVDRKSTLNTDEGGWYAEAGRQFPKHLTVKHTADEYVRGDAHTNTIEGYFSIFKRGMTGTYQHCSEQHLPRYLCEFDFRYNHRKVTDAERAEAALKGASGRHLTYQQPRVADYS